MQEQAVTRGLSGLINIGNSCYMNATIQVLCATDTFVAYFIHRNSPIKSQIKNRLLDLLVVEEEKRTGSAIENFDISDMSVLNAKMKQTITYWIREVLKYMWSENSKIRPLKFKRTLGSVLPFFNNNSQHDSQEFLTALFDKIHEDTASKGILNYTLPIQVDTANIQLRKENPKLFYDTEFFVWLKKTFNKSLYSVINEIFTGISLMITTCTECNFESFTFERNDMLHVAFPQNYNDASVELHSLINAVFDNEVLTEDNQIFCETCKCKKNGIRKGHIYYAPDKLIIYIKKYKQNGQRIEKINTKVSYNHILNIEPWLFDKKETTYELYATIRHSGPFGAGHYYAFCKNPINSLWYIFDDADVYGVDSDEVLKSNSYMLFYQKTSTSLDDNK